MAAPHRIDVHHHPMPTSQISNGRRATPPSMKEWTAAASLDDMNRNSVATAVLSLNHPVVVWPSDQTAARKQAREWNEFMTRQGQDHPGRFGTFAVLPILDVEGSLREIEYALDTLKADGINMMTNIGDKWLGDPYYFPLFEELNRRKAVIYTHPMAPTCSTNLLMPEVNDSVIEFATDTSRAIARILFSGAAHKFKDIRFIFSHAGGTIPFLAERIARLEVRPEFRESVPDGVIFELKRLFFDTALSANQLAFSALLKLVASEQVLFGSDYPFAPEATMAATVKGLANLGLAPDVLYAIERGNAVRLLKR